MLLIRTETDSTTHRILIRDHRTLWYTDSMRVKTTIAAILLSASSIAAQPTDTLKGPDIQQDQLESIGTTDMSGHFHPVEGRPELAAFAVVCDDPNKLAQARTIGSDYIFDLAEMLVDELDTVKAITDAITEDNTTLAQTLQAQLRLRHDPDTARDPLRPQLEALLDEDQRIRLDRILTEYWDRWISANTPDAQDNMKAPPNKQAIRKRIENRLNNQLYQQDIGNAYEYSLRRYRDALQAIYDAIDPTPQQRNWIRERVIQHIKDTRLKATLQQRESVMLEIYHYLDEDRQTKLFAYMTRAAIGRN
jgi:hypothetical protein